MPADEQTGNEFPGDVTSWNLRDENYEGDQRRVVLTANTKARVVVVEVVVVVVVVVKVIASVLVYIVIVVDVVVIVQDFDDGFL